MIQWNLVIDSIKLKVEEAMQRLKQADRAADALHSGNVAHDRYIVRSNIGAALKLLGEI